MLPDLVNSEGELRRPEQRILDLVSTASFRHLGLHVVEDPMAQPVLQKLGVPALSVAEASFATHSDRPLTLSCFYLVL